jgi:hypothetical protein
MVLARAARPYAEEGGTYLLGSSVERSSSYRDVVGLKDGAPEGHQLG